MTFSRRSLIKVGLSSLAYYTTQATTPNWIIRSAQALNGCITDTDRILVIVQQAGGNDGLNTVIPRTDPNYYGPTLRPTLHVPSGSEINLDGLNGFHPKLTRLANWYQQGIVGIVQNVGYTNPNLSHFTSTDYWEYAMVPGGAAYSQGWAARFFDSTCAGSPSTYALTMMTSGISGVPGTFQAITGYTPPAVPRATDYKLNANSDAALRLPAITALNSIATADPELDFLQRSENTAEASVQDVAAAITEPDLVPPGSYPSGDIGDGLKLASQVIRAGFGTKIFYVSQGGYDTHNSQGSTADPLNVGDHPQLLDTFDQAISAFLSEMNLSGNLHRVLVMTFSEFGRRVGQNASSGTDHGTANSLMVFGGKVKGGVYGGQPDLANLVNNGNLAHEVDFRSVYARVIETWFGASAAPVMGQSVYDTTITGDLPKIDFIDGASAVKPEVWSRY